MSGTVTEAIAAAGGVSDLTALRLAEGGFKRQSAARLAASEEG